MFITIGLTFLVAFFYVLATYVMKVWFTMPVVVAVILVLVALAIAVILEIEVLRQARLGTTFILVLAFEVLLTAICGFVILGEVYTARQLAGLGIILLGIGLAGWPEAVLEDADQPSAEVAATQEPGAGRRAG